MGVQELPSSNNNLHQEPIEELLKAPLQKRRVAEQAENYHDGNADSWQIGFSKGLGNT
jgi:hypothetical protein